MYNHFFSLCREQGRVIIQACTSPVNTGSISFHQNLGFEIEKGNGTVDGYPVTLDYNRKGDHKVLFTIRLDARPSSQGKEP